MAKRSTPATSVVRVNRAPVLTLWAAVVAEVLGHDRDTALTLGKAVAGLNAQAKGKRLGIYAETDEADKKPAPRKKTTTVELLGRKLPVVRTKDGLRAARGGAPENPAAIAHYLESKLGDSFAAVRAAMTALARSLPKAELAGKAYALYEKFRPKVPAGEKGWGKKGELDLAALRSLGRERPASRRS